jgi:hypothetical protein
MKSYPVSHLYEVVPEVESTTPPGPNPLSSVGALNEAEFIDMRLSPQRSRVGLLIDTRFCEDFGHVSGLDGAIPDMGELSDAEIITGFPQWSSVMEIREHYVYPDSIIGGLP